MASRYLFSQPTAFSVALSSRFLLRLSSSSPYRIAATDPPTISPPSPPWTNEEWQTFNDAAKHRMLEDYQARVAAELASLAALLAEKNAQRDALLAQKDVVLAKKDSLLREREVEVRILKTDLGFYELRGVMEHVQRRLARELAVDLKKFRFPYKETMEDFWKLVYTYSQDFAGVRSTASKALPEFGSPEAFARLAVDFYAKLSRSIHRMEFAQQRLLLYFPQEVMRSSQGEAYVEFAKVLYALQDPSLVVEILVESK